MKHNFLEFGIIRLAHDGNGNEVQLHCQNIIVAQHGITQGLTGRQFLIIFVAQNHERFGRKTSFFRNLLFNVGGRIIQANLHVKGFGRIRCFDAQVDKARFDYQVFLVFQPIL